ncbi:hypothetical protein DSOUD_3071 [Desulfuromonas soudanensis]|uniref:Outer membrane lipoprotein-sorting protein n=1 Tax=Desulfuromonas soudanensis TaxID=1603606 RepID=A0A0M4D8T1_9BACT|nr:hypothetical protein [Desulfuromonas soudanensis]ALC17797.1 hypothetical protein DSOUD_3071 [Desulfuromonas soudanensis]
MKIFVPVLLALLWSAPVAGAEFDPAPIEAVAAAYAEVQPGLDRYQAVIETDRIAEIFRTMTAGIPPDLPRPTPPTLILFWSRDTGETTISAAHPQPFPTMEEMIRHFSRKFALDMPGLFLPVRGAAERRRLLKAAEVRVSESQLGAARSLTISATFRDPVALGGAFYHRALSLPQKEIVSLAMDFDPIQKVLRRLDVGTASGQRLSAELRHLPCRNGYLLNEVLITSPDGRIDDRLKITFAEVSGFLLPARQERKSRRPEGEERTTVTFVGHRVNLPQTASPVQGEPR